MFAGLVFLVLLAASDTTAPDRLYAAGEFAEAARLYRYLLDQAPRDFNLVLRLGATHYQLGQFPEAAKFFRDAVALRPNVAQAQIGLGTTLLALEQASDALPFLEKAVKLAPSDAMARRALGHAYQKTNKLFEGERLLRSLVASDPNDAESWYYLGALLFDSNYYLPALDALNTALRLQPANDQAGIYKAGALAQLGNTREAGDLYRALADRPAAAAKPELWLGYAQFLFEGNQLEASLQAIDRAIALLPDSPKLYFWRARIGMTSGDLAAAESDARKAVALAPQLPNARNLLMKIYRAKGLASAANEQAAWLAQHESGSRPAAR